MHRALLPVLCVLTLAGAAPSQFCFTTLVPDVPATLTSNCFDFGGNGSPASMNAVGVASASDWNVFASGLQAQGVSAQAGSVTDFLVLQLPFSSTFTGSTGHATTAGPAVLEQVVGTNHSMNVTVPATLQAGHVLRLMSLAVTANGNYQVLVTGNPSLKWFLFDRTHILDWRPRNTAIASGQAGTPSAPIALTAQPHALVITKDGGVTGVDLPFHAELRTAGTWPALLAGTTAAAPAVPAFTFGTSPSTGRWNAVGVIGAFLPQWNLALGGAQSGGSANAVDYVVANGALGTITPTLGTVTHSGTIFSGSMAQASVQLVSVGATGSRAWQTTNLLHVFEVVVTTAGTYNLNVSGPGGLAWSLFAPGGSAAWRPKSERLATGAVGVAGPSLFLGAGRHAIVVSRSGFVTTPVSGTVTCRLAPNSIFFPVLTTASR